MKRPRCQHEDPDGGRIHEDDAARLAIICMERNHPVGPDRRFRRFYGPPALTMPHTPRYLAGRILTSRGPPEGERQRADMLSTDPKNSLGRAAGRDPEQTPSILDPVFEPRMEAVRHGAGTVSPGDGDGITALFGLPLVHENRLYLERWPP